MSDRVRVRLTDSTYVELVRGILSTFFLTVIAGSAFALVGAVAVLDSRDPLLFLLWGGGLATVVLRIIVLAGYRKHRTGPLSPRIAGRIERHFAWSYLGFATVFGAFMARAFALGDGDIRLLVVGMVFGHGAGVAAGAVLRPWIGLPAVLLGVVPTVVTAFAVEDHRLWGVGALTLLYAGGGMATMLRRYRGTARQISLETIFSRVSARDEQTGLANQVALVERFEELSSVHRSDLHIALHVVQLDGFRELNEHYGYIVGDELLKVASRRLGHLAPPGGLAVRLGGVSFALVQAGLDSPEQADAFAAEIHQALSQPLTVSGEDVHVKVSIGYSFGPQEGAHLETVLDEACRARDRARLSGSGIARSRPTDSAAKRRLARSR